MASMKSLNEPNFKIEIEPNKLPASQDSDLRERIRRLVSQQLFCVLCTQGESQPYGSLIAYAFSDDLKQFFFTTPVATRKYKLLSQCRQVALVIDSRSQHQDDMTQVEAVTITGKATEIRSGRDYEQGIARLKSRHPYLAGFLDSASTALFRIDVVRYFHVTRFQEVSQWIP
ncbi:MAG: pyridoxamine 5'-phosphate oxidase family protein [candidate division KSB1 bacterium]|nr:pyridoxamine 5'-phosphate oxidase family protein [candidate division KSB1 bacterium]